MSGYRSLHRQSMGASPIWSVQAMGNPRQQWHIWTGDGEGQMSAHAVQETSLAQKESLLDASALALVAHHSLPGTSSGARLGCSVVDIGRNYAGEDEQAGDWIVVGLDLGGSVRVWTIAEDKSDAKPQAVAEFVVENATGTSLAILKPRLSGGQSTVLGAVGCLDGTIALVSLGLAVPTAKKEAVEAGTIVEVWGRRGASVPLKLAWHPTKTSTLAFGRQDGTIDLLSSDRPHRLVRHHDPVRALTFTTDGHLLISGDDSGMLAVWDLGRPTPSLVDHVLGAHSGWILDMIAIDSRRFITAGADLCLHVWTVSQLAQGPTHTFQTDHAVWTMSTLPTRLVTGSDTGWLQVFSLED